MSIYEKMDYMMPHYTKTDHSIYEYVKKFENSFIHESINDLVTRFNVSQAALTRFAKKLGFDGFTQFQYQLKLEQEYKKSTSPLPNYRSSTYAKLLEATETAIKPKQIEQLGNKILEAQYVYTTGYNLARLPAEVLEIGLRISRIDSISFISTEKFMVAGKNTNRYVLIVYSSNDGKSMKYNIEKLSLSNNKPYICLVTINSKHPLKKYADQVILLPETTMQDYGNKAITETFAYLMLDDILIDYVSTKAKDLSQNG